MSNPPRETSPGPEGVRTYEPTCDGLVALLEDALALHEDKIGSELAWNSTNQSSYSRECLTLYPNPRDPRETITISPTGTVTPESNHIRATRFSETTNRSITFDPGEREDILKDNVLKVNVLEVDGQYVAGQTRGTRILPRMESEDYAGLIAEIVGASAEKPVGNLRRVLRALGSLSHRGATS